MAYGKNKGRFRGIRVGRFDPNMGALAPGVKSTDVESLLKTGSRRAVPDT
jgi:hypothetical protein